MTHAADDIIGLYRRHADAWVNLRGTALVEKAWLEKFCALMAPAAQVLDLGCGFGAPLGAFLLDQGHAVTGVDSSPELIKIAQDCLPAGAWIVGDMRTLNLRQRFGGVLAWDSSFHLTQADQRDLFAILARHSAPGAPLMFTAGPKDGEAMGTFEGEPLFHASLAPSEYRSLLDKYGFDVVDHVIEDPDCGFRTIWLAQKRLT
ncbi:MAG: class I SAM-dependent methyltransferase [Pseudomonadota bacterium]